MSKQQLDASLISKAVSALFKYEQKRTNEQAANGKVNLIAQFAKPIIVQVEPKPFCNIQIYIRD